MPDREALMADYTKSAEAMGQLLLKSAELKRLTLEFELLRVDAMALAVAFDWDPTPRL